MPEWIDSRTGDPAETMAVPTDLVELQDYVNKMFDKFGNIDLHFTFDNEETVLNLLAMAVVRKANSSRLQLSIIFTH